MIITTVLAVLGVVCYGTAMYLRWRKMNKQAIEIKQVTLKNVSDDPASWNWWHNKKGKQQ